MNYKDYEPLLSNFINAHRSGSTTHNLLHLVTWKLMAIELTVVYLYIKSTQVLLNQYSIPSLKVKSIDLLNYIRYLHTGGCYGTPQHGNVSTRKCLKNRFWGISVFLGNPSKLENVEGFPNIFEAFPNI